MLVFMFWRAGAQMRRDRLTNERKARRGRYGFTPFQRVKYLLGRAFPPKDEEPEWQTQLRARLDEARREPDPQDQGPEQANELAPTSSAR